MQLAPRPGARPLERAAARVCGARVTTNTLVRDFNAPVDCLDDRRIEVIAIGLPSVERRPVAVDTTIVSPLTRNAVPRSRRDLACPVALLDVRRQKKRAYPELLRSSQCRLVVLGVEVGGR